MSPLVLTCNMHSSQYPVILDEMHSSVQHHSSVYEVINYTQASVAGSPAHQSVQTHRSVAAQILCPVEADATAYHHKSLRLDC